MSDSSRHLILRRETFGGIAFSSHDATLLELDGEAYEALAEALNVGEVFPKPRGYKLAYGRKILQELGSVTRPKSLRILNEDSILETRIPVFSAPTLVDFQITTRCGEGCPHCYAAASDVGEDAPREASLRAIADFAEAGVCQVALGGGEPLLHPHVGEFLHAIRDGGMVPNITTLGSHLSPENLHLLRTTCGAVALSLEGVGPRFARIRRRGFDAFCSSLETILAANIPTVLQVTVSASNLEDLPSIVDFCLTQPLYGVIFLAYKPVGRGLSFDKPLSTVGPRAAEMLSQAFLRLSGHTRVGYDCCLAPLVAGFSSSPFGEENRDLEGCSALRGSVGVTPSLQVVPCTFLPDHHIGDLNTMSLKEIWKNCASREFRDLLAVRTQSEGECARCPLAPKCLGGCPVMPLVSCAACWC